MTTESQPMQQPTSSPRSFWTRRNVTVIMATLVSAPFAAGILSHLAMGVIDPAEKDVFWPVANGAFSAELVIGAVYLMLLPVSPTWRTRLEIPDENGDERERLIVMKATRSVFAATASTALLGSGLLAILGKDGMTAVPSYSLLYVYLLLQFTYYGAMIYYSKKI